MCDFWLVGSFGELDLRSNFFLFLGTDLGNMRGNFTCVASFGETFYYVDRIIYVVFLWGIL